MLDPELHSFLAQSGWVYRYVERTTSSQDEARSLAAGGAPEGTIVVAEVQTAGRGRQGRSWQSAPGASLTFSLLLRPKLPPDGLALLSFAAGVALREACGVGGLKWPNDLLSLDGHKLAGVLVEAALKPEGVVAVLGIGLNIKPPVPEGAAALGEFNNKSRTQILRSFLQRFEALYQSLASDAASILELWRGYSYTLGREVVIRTARGEMRGRAVALAEDGSLLVESGSTRQVVSAGDVSLIGLLGGKG